jgi:hypothetical protein
MSFFDQLTDSLIKKVTGAKNELASFSSFLYPQANAKSNMVQSPNQNAIAEALKRQEQDKKQASTYLDKNNIDERGAIQRELSNMDLNNAYKQKGISALVQNTQQIPTSIPTVKPTATPMPTQMPQVASAETQRPPVQMARYGQTGDMYISNAKEALGLSDAEAYIIGSESGFRPEGVNKKSEGAFGLGQMIKTQREKYGKLLGINPETIDPNEQLKMVRAYIADRYGDAETAEKFRKVTMGELPISVLPDTSASGFPLKSSAQTYLNNNWRGY